MMKRTTWMQLLTLCADGKVELVVPRVVLEETARHWAKQAQEAVDIAEERVAKVLKSQKSMNYLELGEDMSPIPEAPKPAVDPKQFLEKTSQKLLSLGVYIAPVPDQVDIKTVLSRDLERKKPFNDAGKGFRDVLVWETIKDIVLKSASGEHVIFVTGNSDDFCEGTGLAPELLAEVAGAESELTRVADLDELLASPKVAPAVRSLAKSDEELSLFLVAAVSQDEPPTEAPSVSDSIHQAMLSTAEAMLDDEVQTENDATSGHDFTGLGVPDQMENVSIAWVDPVEDSITWQTYETYDDTTLLIRGEMDAEISLQGLVYKADYYLIDEEVELVDWDSSEHYAHVVFPVEAHMVFQIRVEQGMDHVEECEFEGIEPLPSPDDDDYFAPTTK